MSKRLDNRPNLYGGQRLSNAQVRALRSIRDKGHAGIHTRPATTRSLERMGLARKCGLITVCGSAPMTAFELTPTGQKLLEEIEEYAEDAS